MANLLFPRARQGFLTGRIDWATATIKVSLLRGYSYNATHQWVSDVLAAGTLVATQTLASKTDTDGVADAADVTFPTVAAGASVPHLLIYQSSAVTGGADVATSAQRIIALIDTASNLPITPNGGDINIIFDAGANRIFAL